MRNGISLVTTVYNENENILRFLKSYANQTRLADEFVIVDGGSKDGTVEVIKEYKYRYPDLNIQLIVDRSCSMPNSKGPIAKGRNIAIRNTQFDCIAVTDAGCMLDEHWLERISKPLQDNKADVVAGWYKSLRNNEFQRLYEEVFMPSEDKIKQTRFLPSSRSISFKRRCWSLVGGYPEKTYTSEDTLFDLKLREAGLKFQFVSDAIVYWDCPKSLSEALEKYYSYAYGDGQNRIFLKMYLAKAVLLFFPIDIILSAKKRRRFWISYAVSVYRIAGYFSGLCSTILPINKSCQ